MTVTADDLAIATIDQMLVLVHSARGQRDPVEYLESRLLDMRLAVVGCRG